MREFVREQAEARQEGRPPPVAVLQVKHVNLQRVTGLGAVDPDRPRQVVDGVEVEPRVLVGSAGPDLALAGDLDVEVNGVARVDRQQWLEVGVPLVMDNRRVDHMFPCHASPSRSVRSGHDVSRCLP